MDADSVGGAVNLITKSAFSQRGRRFSYNTGVNYKTLHHVSALFGGIQYSDLFGEKKNVGLYLSVSYSDNPVPQDVTQLDFQGAGVSPVYMYRFRLEDAIHRRNRTGLGAKLDWRVDERTTLYAGLMFNHYTDTVDQTRSASASTARRRSRRLRPATRKMSGKPSRRRTTIRQASSARAKKPTRSPSAERPRSRPSASSSTTRHRSRLRRAPRPARISISRSPRNVCASIARQTCSIPPSRIWARATRTTIRATTAAAFRPRPARPRNRSGAASSTPRRLFRLRGRFRSRPAGATARRKPTSISTAPPPPTSVPTARSPPTTTSTSSSA